MYSIDKSIAILLASRY